MGVSQMPVREALKELAAEGLVEHVPYRGVRVVEFYPNDVTDLYTHRAFLEGRAARVASTHITPEECDELETLINQMGKRLGPRHITEYRDLNRRFHQIIFTSSRRAYLTRTLNQMWLSFPTMLFANFARTANSPLPGRDTSDVEEHTAILKALRAHDGETAERLMRDHIEGSAQALLVLLKSV
jgi:DNA-binding GntR family transcriptional regulator